MSPADLILLSFFPREHCAGWVFPGTQDRKFCFSHSFLLEAGVDFWVPHEAYTVCAQFNQIFKSPSRRTEATEVGKLVFQMRPTVLVLDDYPETELPWTPTVPKLQLPSLAVLSKGWSRVGLTPSIQPDSSQSQVGTVGVGAWGWCSWNLPKEALRAAFVSHVTSVSSPRPYSWRASPSSYPVLTLHKQNGLILMAFVAVEDGCLGYGEIPLWSWQMPAAVDSSSSPQVWALGSCALGFYQPLVWVSGRHSITLRSCTGRSHGEMTD